MGAVYSQLSLGERRRIERWRAAKVPVDEMARALKRCRSTIFRELRRNHFSDLCLPKCEGCYGAAAQLMTADRRAGSESRSVIRSFASRIRSGWTSERIAHRMFHEKTHPRVRPGKRSAAASAPRTACARSSDGTCRPTASGRRRSSTAMSASCFDRTRWRTGSNSAIGRLT